MRRLVLVPLLALVAAVANAAGPFYLSRGGTLWQARATQEGLVLSAEFEGRILASMVVPYEIGLSGSFDNNIQVVADDVSGKVAVVWQRNWSETASEILMAVWSAGKWESIVHLGSGLAVRPRNPNVTLTVSETSFPALPGAQSTVLRDTYLHVLWWEGNQQEQQGMYALLYLNNSSSSKALEVHPLDSLLPVGMSCNALAPSEVLEHPLFTAQASSDHALAFFGSQRTCLFQLVEVTFVLEPHQPAEQMSAQAADRRRHVPVFGIKKVFEVPTALGLENARVLLSPDLSPVVYRVNGSVLEYMVGSSTGWSAKHTLTVRDGLTLDQAIPLIENLAR
jgi:hypothetical protein